MFYVYGFDTEQFPYGLHTFVCISQYDSVDDAANALAPQAKRRPHIIYTVSDIRPYWWSQVGPNSTSKTA